MWLLIVKVYVWATKYYIQNKDFNQIFNKFCKMNYVVYKEILCHLSYLHVCEL